MEKLLKLLNQYEEEERGEFADKWTYYDTGYHRGEDGYYYSELLIISNIYGFIQWLVENDKIDRKKIEKNQTYQLCLGLLIDRGYYVNVLLMLLSISSSPIEDLISYLK